MISLAAGLAVLGALASDAREPDDRPNVVVIFADDLGYGDLGCFGHPQFTTPNLDQMAAGGMRLTQFYVPTPYCAPSRAAILTGRYPFRSGMVHNPAPDAGIDDLGIPESEWTLAEALRSAGYATAAIGKWHLGHQPRFRPTRHGFDSYFGILYSNDMRPVELWEDERMVEYPVVQATLTRRYTERAVRFIEQQRSTPFFLYLAHAMPHKPLACSEDFYMKSPAGLYGDVIAELDWSVGQILATLDRLDLGRRTLVIFTSDNGPFYGGSTGGLRGMKGKTFEGGVRVPMIARWPGRIPAGGESHALAGVIDVLPTAVKLSGQALPDGVQLDGRDLGPLLWEGTDQVHDSLFVMRAARLMAIRSGRWKLHVHSPGPDRWFPDDWQDPRAPDGVTILAPFEQARPAEYPGQLGPDATAMMLFDLEADPGEQRNVAADHPEIVARLKRDFDVMNAQVPDIPSPTSKPLARPGPRPGASVPDVEPPRD